MACVASVAESRPTQISSGKNRLPIDIPSDSPRRLASCRVRSKSDYFGSTTLLGFVDDPDIAELIGGAVLLKHEWGGGRITKPLGRALSRT